MALLGCGLVLFVLASATRAHAADRVPMFVAQGSVGRTTISCDDGQSWVENQSDDDSARCFESPGFLDCDNHSGSARGIAYDGDYFIATFGFGPPGTVRRSLDGLSWESVFAHDLDFGQMLSGEGIFMAAARFPYISSDAGETWSPGTAQSITGFAVRDGLFVPGNPARFIIHGNAGDLAISTDAGQSFFAPTTYPNGCAASGGRMAHGGGAIIVAASDGTVCRSIDGGVNWTLGSVGGDIGSQVVWTGSEFMAWTTGTLYRSADAATWTSEPTTPTDLNLGAVGIGDTGTLVAVRGGFRTWYEEQAFYRSADGVNWTPLSASQFTGSHPITHIAFGLGAPSAACPADPPVGVPTIPWSGQLLMLAALLGSAWVALGLRRQV